MGKFCRKIRLVPNWISFHLRLNGPELLEIVNKQNFKSTFLKKEIQKTTLIDESTLNLNDGVTMFASAMRISDMFEAGNQR